MNNKSLQDQLLNAGLTTETKAKQVKTEKRKQNKQKQKNKKQLNPPVQSSHEVEKAKLQAKDKALNKQKQDEKLKKDIQSQVLQLIEKNKVEIPAEGEPYRFSDQNKVKTLFLNDDLRKQVIGGKLAIVKGLKTYYLVPAAIAEKIKLRDADAILVLFDKSLQNDADEEYADFEIPDDLMW